MSLVQVPADLLIPDVQLQAADKNIATPKLLVPVYAQQGAAGFGYNVVSAIRQMTFEIGSLNCAMAPKDSYLQFGLKVAAGTTGILAGSADQLFSRVRLTTASGVVLVDSQNHALYAQLEDLNTLGAENKAKSWESLRDQVAISDLNSLVITSTLQNVILPLRGAFWQQVRSLPLPILGNVRLTFDMNVDFDAFSLTGSTAFRYAVDSPVLYVSMIPYTQSFLDQLRQLASAGSLLLNYSQNYYLQAPCTATSNVINISYNMRSMRGIFGCVLLASEANTFNLMTNKPQSPTALSSIQLRQGSDQYPSTAIVSTEQVFVEAKKLWNTYNDIDGGCQSTRANFTQAVNTGVDQKLSSTFNFGIETDKNGINTGLSTAAGGANLVYNVGTAHAATSAIHTFSIYDCIVVIRSNTNIEMEY